MDKQRDFEKGWEEYKAKNKEEVEELSVLLYGLSLETLQDSRRVAKFILKHYQPKTSENAVVLTREEYDEFLRQNALIDMLKDCVKLARKETAEKFAERLKASGEIIALTAIGKGEIVEAVLKRIDEIAKEITGEESGVERCVVCGAIIPEGRQVCPNCEKGEKK